MDGRSNSNSINEEKEGDQDDDFYLDSFNCPIEMSPFKTPVIAADGHSYEWEAFRRWMTTRNTSPLTNNLLASTTVQENHVVTKAIEEFKRDTIPKLQRLKKLEQERELLQIAQHKKIEKDREREKEVAHLKAIEKNLLGQIAVLEQRVERLNEAKFYEQRRLLQEIEKGKEREKEIELLKKVEQMYLQKMKKKKESRYFRDTPLEHPSSVAHENDATDISTDRPAAEERHNDLTLRTAIGKSKEESKKELRPVKAGMMHLKQVTQPSSQPRSLGTVSNRGAVHFFCPPHDPLRKQPGFDRETPSKLQQAKSRSLQAVTRIGLNPEGHSDVRLHPTPSSPSKQI